MFAKKYVHSDCKNLDLKENEQLRDKIIKQYCLQGALEYRKFWYQFYWRPDLIFTLKDKNVLIIQFQKQGVNRLLCTEEQYEQKKRAYYDAKRFKIFYDQTHKQIRVRTFWDIIKAIGDQHYKAKNIYEFKAQKLRSEIEEILKVK